MLFIICLGDGYSVILAKYDGAAYMMQVTMNLYLLLDNIIQLSVKILRELADYVQADPVSVFLTLGSAFAGYVILNIYKYVASKRTVSLKLDILIYILSPFIYILFTYYAVQSDETNPLFLALNYLGIFWISGALMRVPSKYYGIKVRLYYIPSILLIAVALVLSAYIDMAAIYSDVTEKGLKGVLVFARGLSKILMMIGIFIYLRAILPRSVKMLESYYPKITAFATLSRLVMTAYTVVALLWVLNMIVLDFRAVMSFALLGMMLALLSYILYKVRQNLDRIYKRALYTELEWMQIQKSLGRFMLLTFAYIYYSLVYNALNMSDVLAKLKKIYFFETKLFSLSVLSLISAVFIFMYLKSLLFLLTKYLRVIFSDRSLSDDTDSLEIIVYNMGLLLVIMSAMLQLGITWQIVVPAAGALGIGIGFGLQAVINNYICGFILLFSKKVRIGDFVELPGSAGSAVGVQSGSVFGRVVSIDMFATTVQTYDNIEIMVPNSIFISETIINYTRSDKFIRVRVPVGIAYSSDIDLAQKLMREAIEDCEHVVKHKGQDVWFMGYGESSLDFMVLFWLNMSEGFQITAVKNVFLTSLWHKFKEHDIEIPFPQSDVWFRNELHMADKTVKEND